LIDLNVHQGAHPRMGAADVVPFVPIEGVTIEDCVAMARHVGEQIWKRYQIPVYLYEAAATIPERQNLESIRRGQFEGIRAEIAGLIPKKALEQAAEWFLQIENFDSSLILENRLSAVMGGKLAIGGLRAGVEPFVEQLAAPTATPGGGSAAAASGAMAAGLATMVASLSRAKKVYAQFEPQLSEAISKLSQLREELKASIDADAESYNSVMAAYKTSRESAEADGIVESALKQATSIPLAVAQRAREVLRISDSLGAITNPNMKSDLTTSSALARAAIEGALANVEINLE